MVTKTTKKALALELGISRRSLYYQSKLTTKDWQLKIQIEEILNKPHCHSYGHKRLAEELKINKKRVLRVMKKFGIKPYRRRGRKYRKPKEIGSTYPNLLLTNLPRRLNHIWVSDFTHIGFHGRWVYMATVMDILSREIVGFSILTGHSVQLITNALLMAAVQRGCSEIIHSDQGSEYKSKTYTKLVLRLSIKQSMSRKASPWENGYQESFYNQFKIDLGDPNRFGDLGELVAAIYQQIHLYNTKRIHSALKMSPRQYILKILNNS